MTGPLASDGRPPLQINAFRCRPGPGDPEALLFKFRSLPSDNLRGLDTIGARVFPGSGLSSGPRVFGTNAQPGESGKRELPQVKVRGLGGGSPF